MSVTDMDDTPGSRAGRIRLTTAALPLRGIGERVARTLMEMIATRSEAESSVIECPFVPGDSTRPRG